MFSRWFWCGCGWVFWRAFCGPAPGARLGYGGEMFRRNESLIEKAQDGVGESGGVAVAIFPVGEHFLTALEQGCELLLGEFQPLAHGLDVRAGHQAEVTGLDSLDLLNGLRRQDFLAETPVCLDLDGFDKALRLILGGGKMDVEGGGVCFGTHVFFFKKARMASSSFPEWSVCMEIITRWMRLPWRAILT